jgi:cellulose synthase/poly-beta-1,6-N-acetylglucosamine synthase-like glycosyltransferase
MSNGANLAFSKEAFEQVGGYSGIDHMASGDDYLLMMKIAAAYPDGILYLKSEDAIVTTAPQPTWRDFISQRVRWASKSGKYSDARLTAILVLVYLFNLWFVVLLLAGIAYPFCLVIAGAILVVKTAAELFFLLPVARFFRRRSWIWLFALLQPLHIAYIVVAGFLGFAGSYQWKGRRVK